MNMARGNPNNCPPGLQYLTTVDELLVHQQVEMLEVLTGFETENRYTIKNSSGQNIYYALEDSPWVPRNHCGGYRAFDMRIIDNHKNEVIHLYRSLACDSCCFPNCLQSMEVYAPPGRIVGTIEQKWSICHPLFELKDERGNTIFRIKGPICTTRICRDVDFNVMSSDGSVKVGKISKQWSGLLREMFTDADYFGITFPMDLNVRVKTLMLGACFLIDFMFYET